MKKYVLVAFLALALLLVGCKNGPTGNAVAQDLSLKELCTQDGNMFMKMGPVIEGIPTGEPACYGCMIGNNHVCDKNQYLEIADN